MEGLGYRVENLSVPDVRAFQIGKEYGNNGQCNPTYFTVGNLVRRIEPLRLLASWSAVMRSRRDTTVAKQCIDLGLAAAERDEQIHCVT